AIAVTNSGPSDAATVSWSDTNYQTTTFVSLSAPAGWSCTTPAAGGTGTTTCSTASLAAGATANFSLTWHVASSSNVLTIQNDVTVTEIGRASCRERVKKWEVEGCEKG